ncbi:hypothetical protein FK178_13465 [Antarcticibacterium arcticum]|uniref:Uncharacterized protein n=1 Tax=Antarcticibacterium arcticum TaxID=2585771 RepID=A0A5B8YRE3_9FLAO|nr:hypothetical protein [Antarcticibacterium arcticum]QED38659.1 hypothetical protein FK178_13465 [Antarcticibacterium arcticum]
MRKLKIKNILSLAAAVFGIITILASSAVLFDFSYNFKKEGNYPMFILVVNFISGWLYLLAAYGINYSKTFTLYLLPGILTMLFFSLSFFIQLMITGGMYETDTLVALFIRIAITGGLTYYVFNKSIKEIKQ